MEEKKGKGIPRMLPALVAAGCLFIGVAFGLIYERVSAGTLIGLGTGLMALAVIRFFVNTRRAKP